MIHASILLLLLRDMSAAMDKNGWRWSKVQSSGYKIVSPEEVMGSVVTMVDNIVCISKSC